MEKVNIVFIHYDKKREQTMKKLTSRLLLSLQEAIRVRHYSYRTEQTYLSWAKRFILFHNKQHPRKMGGKEVQQFLNHLALEREVSAATQNQALNALVFMYRHVINQPLGKLDGLIYAKRRVNIPS